MICPIDKTEMELRRIENREVSVKGVILTYSPEHYVCPKCGLEADDCEMGAKNFGALMRAYCAKVEDKP